MDVELSSLEGCLVYLDPANDNSGLTAIDNASPTRVIGLINQKITPLSAEIVLLGEIDFTIARGHLYVGADGKLSLTCPTGDYLQRMGFSFGNGRIFLNPSEQRVKRTP